jgi:hypothetical protein
MRPLCALTAFLLLPAVAPAADKLADALARVRAARDAVDFTAVARLAHVTGPGAADRRNYGINVKAHAFPDGLFVFCEVNSPADARIRMLLAAPSTGPMTVRTGHAGDPAPHDVPASHWGEGLLGTDFVYEDLLETQFTWKRQTLVKEADYGARHCYVIRSEPDSPGQSVYRSVTSWIDRDIYFPVKADKVLKDGKTKEFIYFGLRQVKGVWTASQIECKTEGKPGSSLLVINRGSTTPHHPRMVFDPKLLVRP